MNKYWLIFIFVIFLSVTTVILIFQPKSHKHIMFENKDFKLVMMTQKAQVVKNEVEVSIPQIEISTPKISLNSAKNVKTSNSNDKKTNNKINTQQNTNKNNKTSQKPQNQQKATDKIKNHQSDIKPKPQQNNNVSIPKKKVTSPNHQDVVTQKPTQQAQTTRTLTAEELEIIAWNKWRSDLQNKLMKDSKINAPIGTTFYFSFTVDKFGTISNLRTWSNNSSYTPLAVRVIKPLLLSYQGKSILNFPQNSKRITTNANGQFTMSYSSRYSSPSDYNDYERIK